MTKPYQRKDGRWCVAASLGWVNGKYQRKYFYGDTRRDVLAQLKKFELHALPNNLGKVQFAIVALKISPYTKNIVLGSFAGCYACHAILHLDIFVTTPNDYVKQFANSIITIE